MPFQELRHLELYIRYSDEYRGTLTNRGVIDAIDSYRFLKKQGCRLESTKFFRSSSVADVSKTWTVSEVGEHLMLTIEEESLNCVDCGEVWLDGKLPVSLSKYHADTLGKESKETERCGAHWAWNEQRSRWIARL